MNRIMIDLETYAKGPDALVLSLGACYFDLEEVGHSFYMILDRGDQWGKREIDPETIKWWDTQDPELRSALLDAPQTPVIHVLESFTNFVDAWADFPDSVEVWGSGSDFDNVILSTLYRDFKMRRPWGYSGNRCYRTLKNIAQPFKAYDLPVHEGPAHNALADAQYQAAMCGRYLKGTLK